MACICAGSSCLRLASATRGRGSQVLAVFVSRDHAIRRAASRSRSPHPLSGNALQARPRLRADTRGDNMNARASDSLSLRPLCFSILVQLFEAQFTEANVLAWPTQASRRSTGVAAHSRWVGPDLCFCPRVEGLGRPRGPGYMTWPVYSDERPEISMPFQSTTAQTNTTQGMCLPTLRSALRSKKPASLQPEVASPCRAAGPAGPLGAHWRPHPCD